MLLDLLSYWDNEGNRDYVEHNVYKPPNSDLDIMLEPHGGVRDKMRAENRAYIEGYEIARAREVTLQPRAAIRL